MVLEAILASSPVMDRIIPNLSQAPQAPHFDELVMEIEARSILIVFDNMNASSNEIKTFVEQLFLQSSHTLSKGKVIFCSTEQPFWYSPVEEARGHVKAFELLGLTFEDVEREFGVAVPKMQLKAVHNATGGHPMAIRLLVVRI